jgi:hypothetical protein
MVVIPSNGYGKRRVLVEKVGAIVLLLGTRLTVFLYFRCIVSSQIALLAA